MKTGKNAAIKEQDVVVLGGGPAGLAAGMHLSRAGYQTLLVERDEPGGQARRIEWIENYPGFPAGIRGRDLMALWFAQARRWRLKFLRAEVRKIVRQDRYFRVDLTEGPVLRSRAVVCCVGAEFKRLNVPGEAKFQGRGIGNAPFEEAARFRNKTVAVVGGGETALHQAILLGRFARRVYLLSRGADIKAHRLLRQRAAHLTNLVHLPYSVVERIEGRDQVERISIRNTASGQRTRLAVSGVFVLIGKRKINLYSSGSGRSPGYFTAGDASGTLCRQVAVAAGEGVKTAMRCIRHLEE